MNNWNMIYYAERTRTVTEQREVDRRAGELAASFSRRWRAFTGALRHHGQGFAVAPAARQGAASDDYCAAGSTG
jgi:hypothetical protein